MENSVHFLGFRVRNPRKTTTIWRLCKWFFEEFNLKDISVSELYWFVSIINLRVHIISSDAINSNGKSEWKIFENKIFESKVHQKVARL